MKNGILTIICLLFVLSCGKEKTISEELEGDWYYERETFNSFSSIEDPDVEGSFSFREDETGNWNSSTSIFDFDLEWDLQANDEKISITKSLIGQVPIFPVIRIYDITRASEDKFTFTYHFKIESAVDTIDGFEQFENIIITRLE